MIAAHEAVQRPVDARVLHVDRMGHTRHVPRARLDTLLRATDLGVPAAALPLLWVVFHISKSGWSIPGGMAADRLGARPVIVSGWVLYAIVYAAFAAARSHDKNAVFNVGEEIDNACESCHIVYWYPTTPPGAK